MGENSGIQWTTHTFNPWVGCQRVSPGCTNCYAEAYDKRVGGLPKNQRMNPNVPELRWGPTAPRVRTSLSNWRKPLAWSRAAQMAGRRDRVFCSSLADVFEDRSDLEEHRRDLFRLIAQTPHLDWLLLTKRPENLRAMLPWTTGFLGESLGGPPPGVPWLNVWLGTTVEDQQRANERISHLLSVPAVVHFLSCEPLLESVDLESLVISARCPGCGQQPLASALNQTERCGCTVEGAEPIAWDTLDWLIIGGESGPGARPFDLAWARSLVSQCRDAGVAPFVKQLGAVPISSNPDDKRHAGDTMLPSPFRLVLQDRSGGDETEWPEDLRVREFPR